MTSEWPGSTGQIKPPLCQVCSYQRVFPKLNEPQEKDSPMQRYSKYAVSTCPYCRHVGRTARPCLTKQMHC